MRTRMIVAVTLAAGVALGVAGGRAVGAENPLGAGKVIDRTVLAGEAEEEGILVLREVPPGAESGKHTQSETEIVYVLDGSVTLEVQGKAPVTVKAGEAFHTSKGEVHNVKNASATAPVKALAFYVAKKGTTLEGLSIPAK